jgi:hypothetical protein
LDLRVIGVKGWTTRALERTQWASETEKDKRDDEDEDGYLRAVAINFLG